MQRLLRDNVERMRVYLDPTKQAAARATIPLTAVQERAAEAARRPAAGAAAGASAAPNRPVDAVDDLLLRVRASKAPEGYEKGEEEEDDDDDEGEAEAEDDDEDDSGNADNDDNDDEERRCRRRKKNKTKEEEKAVGRLVASRKSRRLVDLSPMRFASILSMVFCPFFRSFFLSFFLFPFIYLCVYFFFSFFFFFLFISFGSGAAAVVQDRVFFVGGYSAMRALQRQDRACWRPAADAGRPAVWRRPRGGPQVHHLWSGKVVPPQHTRTHSPAHSLIDSLDTTTPPNCWKPSRCARSESGHVFFYKRRRRRRRRRRRKKEVK